MKFSLNLSQNYSNVELKSLPHDEVLARIGAQLGAVEDAVEWARKYHGILIAKVVACEKHPDADKLSLCLIDDGGVADNVERNESGFVQVVCGAANVREGLLVAWIPPGATVPSTVHTDPFVLEVREIRGKISNGMIGSPKELDISDEHEGILEINVAELEREPKLGEPLSDFYGLDDFVVNLENKMFTHRPDCFGNNGVARELAGIFGLKFKSPDWYLNNPEFTAVNNTLALDVVNSIPNLVPRFMVVAVSNLEVTPSPITMQASLRRVGIKPINNVVDMTNYIMHLTGQPLHAFDYDKLIKVSGSDTPALEPRMATENEEIMLLGGKKVSLSEQDIVISASGKAVALAGVMGGAETEVDSSTTRIVIECANFDMYAIRRTSMRHGLFTDAVTRYNKGQSPLQNDRIMYFALNNMIQYFGAVQASNVFDLCDFDLSAHNLNHVDVDLSFINERLGAELDIEYVKTLLENVEFEVVVNDHTLSVTAPFWRMDIAIAEDILEEVGRLHGYNKLTPVLPSRISKPTPKNELRDFKKQLRYSLKETGANEVLTYSFIHEKLMQSVGIDAQKWAYHLRNAISPDLQYYRTSLLPSLLAKIHANLKAQAGQPNNEFALFEIGKAHLKGHNEESEPGLPKQMHRLAMVIAVDNKTSSKYSGSPYYLAKKYVDLLCRGQSDYLPLDTNEYPLSSPFQIGRSAIVMLGSDKKPVGVVGEFTAETKKALKLPDFCAGFEIDIELLLELVEPVSYEPLSKHPSSTQDITFEVTDDKTWGDLLNLLHAELAVAKAESGYNFEINPLEIFKKDDSEKKRISFRIDLSHDDKTLRVEEINKLLDGVAEAVNEKFEATRI